MTMRGLPAIALPYAVVACAAVLAHLPALSGGFIWLDHAHIEQGLALLPFEDSLSHFTRGFAGTGFYRPLVSLSLSLDAALGGAPWLYHATTLSWHALASVLLVALARTLGLGRTASTLAGLFFGVHPANTLVASAIAFRSEAMSAALLLGLLVCHLRKRPLGAALCLLGGALTKESALVLGPLLVLALELGNGRDPLPADTRRARAFLLGGEAVALATVLLLRASFAPEWRALSPDLPLAEALGTRLATLTKTSAWLLALGDRTLSDAFPVTSLSSGPALTGALLCLGLAYLAWERRGTMLWFVLALVPTLQLVPVMRWWSPHYLYVPLAFAALVGAELVEPLGRRVFAWASPLLVTCGAIAWFDTSRFQSDEALWSREVALHPECREAQFFMGEVARGRHAWHAAAKHYGLAIERSPRHLAYVDLEAAYGNLGIARLELGEHAAALDAFRRSLELSSEETARRRMSHNVAMAALLAGDAEAAVRSLEPETRRDDALPASLLVQARALLALGRVEEAERMVERSRLAMRHSSQ
jgi:tetratricopeptide (TPR) repeat protein